MAEGYASNSYSVNRVHISATTSPNATVLIPAEANGIPIYFYGWKVADSDPVYAIFGKYWTSGDDKSMKIFDRQTQVGQVVSTPIEGYLYYLA